MDDAVVLPVTLVATVACMGLNIWSDARIGHARLAVRRGQADAALLLAGRQAAASAFRGNALFLLMMLGLLELARTNGALLAAAAAAFVAARAVLIAGADRDHGLARGVAVNATLATQLVLAVGGVVVAIDAVR